MTVDAAQAPTASTERLATSTAIAGPRAIGARVDEAARPEPLAALRGAARNTAWGGIGGVIGAASTFLATLIIARAAGATDAGVLYSAIAVATIAIGVLTLGADTGLVWSLARDRALAEGRHIRALVYLASGPVVLVSVVGASIGWFAARPLATALGGGSALVSALQVVVLAVALGPLETVLAQATRGLGDVRPLVLLHRAGVPLGRCAALALVALVGDPTVANLALAWTAPVLVALVASAIVLARRATATASRAPAETPTAGRGSLRALGAQFWRYALPRGIATTGSLALTWADVLLVAALASPREAGIYAAASRFALAGQLAIQALRLGIAPQISVANARGDHGRVGLLYDVTGQWAIVTCWPLCVTIAGFAPVFLGLFGPEFRSGSTALAVIIAGVMVAVAAGNVGTVLLMTGNSAGYARLVWTALAVNVLVNVVAIPRLGILGAAVAWAASMAVENFGGVLLLRRRGEIRPNGTGLATTGAVTLGMAAAAYGIARLVAGPDLVGLAVHLALVLVGIVGVVLLRRDALQLRAFLGRRTLGGTS